MGAAGSRVEGRGHMNRDEWTWSTMKPFSLVQIEEVDILYRWVREPGFTCTSSFTHDFSQPLSSVSHHKAPLELFGFLLRLKICSSIAN